MATNYEYSPSQPSAPGATFVYDSEYPSLIGNNDQSQNYEQFTAVKIQGQADILNTYDFEDDEMYDTPKFLNCGNNTGQISTSPNIDCEMFQTTQQNDDHPNCNQQLFTILDDVLFNLSKSLYIEKLLSLTKQNESDIFLYRSILLRRARTNSSCPTGTLKNRRSTEKDESWKRYAYDCCALQDFINNGDPKCIIDLFTKRKQSIKPDGHDDTNDDTHVMTNTLQNELADINSKYSLLKQELENTKSKYEQSQLRLEQLDENLKNMKSYTADMVTAMNRSLSYHTHLFEHLKQEVLTLKKNANPNYFSQTPIIPDKSVINNAPKQPNTLTSNPIKSLFQENVQNQSNEQISNKNEHNALARGDAMSNQQSDKQTKESQKIKKNNGTSNDEHKNNESDATQNKDTTTYADALKCKATQNRGHVSAKHIAHSQQSIRVRITSQDIPSDSNIRGTDGDNMEEAPIVQPSGYHSENNQHTDQPIFESVSSQKTRRYYVGGIATYSNRTGMFDFLNSRDVKPAAIKLIDTKRGSLAAKITIYQEDWNIIEQKSFWPGKLYCRRWYSENEWESMFYTTAEKEKERYTTNRNSNRNNCDVY